MLGFPKSHNIFVRNDVIRDDDVDVFAAAFTTDVTFISSYRQENDRLHMELDRRDMAPPPSYGLRDRSRSPEPGYGSRSVHVEVAELKDKLEQTQNELRRTQAELRLNQGDYERSHVELETMQEKVRKCTYPPKPKMKSSTLFGKVWRSQIYCYFYELHRITYICKKYDYLFGDKFFC